MGDKYRIVSDGKKTEVFDQYGKMLKNVVAIEFKQEAGHPIIARITLVAIMPLIDIDMSKGDK